MRRLLAFLFHIQTSCSLLASQSSPPNIIIFLTDDLGWGDLACYGHPRIKTPHLDKFATDGVRFTQAYSACGVCSPSRSSILTGRTPYRNGVWRWLPSGNPAHLRKSEITIPELLKPLGYQTMHSGKWHLNGHFNSDRQPQPNDHGYDWWFATQNNASPSHKNPNNFVRNGQEVGLLKGFSAPLVAQEANQWLKKERDPEKPFFLTVWTHEPHLPIESDPEFQKHYSDIENPGIRQHHGNVTQLDHAFGKLMKTLDDLNLRENTFVVFTSDNGPEGSGKGKLSAPDSQQNRTWGSTGGLRGRKRDSHEGGIRVPAIIRWPGKIKPGTTSDIPIIGSDLFSTALAIADLPLPADRTIDGVNILPACEGKAVERPVPLFWRTHIAPAKSHAAMRINNWKIVANEQLTEFQLYDIVADWKEEHNRATQEPEKLAAMKAKFLEVWQDIENEGPNEWWKNEAKEDRQRQSRKKASAKLSKGKDTTGDFQIVQGAIVSPHEFGYVLDSENTEGFALQKLTIPLQEPATFKVRYRSAGKGSTHNACFCFGPEPSNDSLYKAGTMMGMGKYGIFDGSWSNLKNGTLKNAPFKNSDTFEATITIDLEHGKARLKIGEITIEEKLPASLEQVSYIGIYTKNTRSYFSKIKRVR
ncbi:MAG: sulfatase [Akkermansiaceae bacterium]